MSGMLTNSITNYQARKCEAVRTALHVDQITKGSEIISVRCR
jgi:hypothetical protein